MIDVIPHKSQDAIPSQLYHYTSLESLAMILSTKTIRLMPITQMDDLQEARTSDIPNLGRFVFASSWTDDPTESIPMWNMYASLESGVRICLPTMPFKRYRLTPEEYSRQTKIPIDHISTDSDFIESFLPPDIYAKKLMSPMYMSDEGVLVKVEYTSDKGLLEPSVLSANGEEPACINIGMLGKYKNEYWSFQREWRYQLIIIPFDPLDMSGDVAARLAKMTSEMLLGILPSPCPCYDLHISDEAMDQLEVVASPKMSEGNRLMLKMLLDHYGLGRSLRQSSLTGLLR